MRLARLALLLIGLASWASTAEAHGGSGSSLNPGGIEIPSSSHGELVVLEGYYGRIMALADSAASTNPQFRKLVNFAHIQRYYCLWGMAPGAASDENSPFNQCTHAYLSAAKQVLISMRDMPGLAPRANELLSDLDADMVRRGEMLIGCQYSADVFSTTNVAGPNWELLWQHPKTLAAAAAPLAALAITGLTLAAPMRRKRTPKE